MSDANLSEIAKISETTLGQTPAAPELTKICFTGESLRNNKENVQSQCIRADRQVPDSVKVHTNPEGSFNFELDYDNWDAEWAGALGSAPFNNVAPGAGDLAIDSGANTITDNGGGGIFSDVLVGGLIKIANAEDGGNDGLHRVTAVDAPGNVITVVAGTLGATNANDTSAEVTQQAIVNGALKPSQTIEKKILNNQGEDYFQVFRGMVVDTFNINIESRQIITGEVSFIGMTRETGDDTIDNDTIYSEPQASDILNGTSNVGTITIDGNAATERFKSISIEIANNLRGKDALGVEGNFDIGTGTFTVTGSLMAYFQNNDFLDKMDANTSFALEFSVSNAAGDALHIFMPNCKPTNGDPSIEGINTDVMVELEYQAILDLSYGITMAINKVPA